MAFPEQDIEVLNGRWGPYIKQGKNNYKIPKSEDAKALTLDKIQELIEGQGKSKKTKKK
ncbi:MAG: hypothetical protein LRY27_04775 [Chitinophagales bacterium]|nr:hypothetical protein [Chitinophagales bacterium]